MTQSSIQSPVTIQELRNLETLFGPRLEVGARKFGELAPLKPAGFAWRLPRFVVCSGLRWT